MKSSPGLSSCRLGVAAVLTWSRQACSSSPCTASAPRLVAALVMAPSVTRRPAARAADRQLAPRVSIATSGTSAQPAAASRPLIKKQIFKSELLFRIFRLR